MAFPPPDKKKPKPPGPGGPPGPGPAGGGAPPGLDPFGPVPAGSVAMPPNMDPFGGGGMPPFGGPSMPKPGQSVDPMMAMLHGIGPDPLGAGPPPPQGPPLGPAGVPVGGSIPKMNDEDGDETMGGSDLLTALAGALNTKGDPYAQPPMGPDMGFQGQGTGDPNMGLEQLLQLLALSQQGVGGSKPGAGASGLDTAGPAGNIGTMVGL